jgi:acetolactate synthase-1/2/3 large subunit
MIETDSAVVVDVMVDPSENVFPMIPAGAAHYEMKLGAGDAVDAQPTEDGMVLV